MSLQINLEDRHLVILGAIILAAVAVRLAIGATGITPLNPGHPLSQTWIDTDLDMATYNVLTSGKVSSGLLDVGSGKMIVTSGGNVGIGTTTPKNKLDVEGGAVVGAGYSGTNTAPANGLLVEGNVGVGTTSPARKLHVTGTGISISNDNVDRSSIYWDSANSRLVIKVS